MTLPWSLSRSTSRRQRRRTAVPLAVVGLAAGLVAPTVAATSAGAAAPAAKPTTSVYVAMGDSYSAGPLIPPQVDANCFRSSANYPSLVAAALGATTFRDVTCSSAATKDFSNPQSVAGGTATVPPQYDALSADTTLVTIGIGGNDIGLIQVGLGCIAAGINPSLPNCADSNGHKYERKINAFAATYGDVIAQVRERSPLAKIMLVGYPTGIRDGGCYPTQPIRPTDATYLQHLIDKLNYAMNQEAVANGATYVNLLPSTVGHDACAPFPTEWVEGAQPQQPAAPLHPNALGMANAAKIVVRTFKNTQPS